MLVYKVISEYPGLDNLNESSIRKAAIDRSVDVDADYLASLQRLTDLVIADCLVALVNLPDFSEDDLSENYSRESMLKSAERIYNKYGDSNGSKQTITSRNVW